MAVRLYDRGTLTTPGTQTSEKKSEDKPSAFFAVEICQKSWSEVSV